MLKNCGIIANKPVQKLAIKLRIFAQSVKKLTKPTFFTHFWRFYAPILIRLLHNNFVHFISVKSNLSTSSTVFTKTITSKINLYRSIV